MLNASRLRLLAELEDRGSLSAVAAALGYTPSAVSQQLAKLEAETGSGSSSPSGAGSSSPTRAARWPATDARSWSASRRRRPRSPTAASSREGCAWRRSRPPLARSSCRPSARFRASSQGPECELHDQEAEAALPLLRAGELDVVVAEEYTHAPRPRDPRLTRHDLGADEPLVAPAAITPRRGVASPWRSQRSPASAGPPPGPAPPTRRWSRAPAVKPASNRTSATGSRTSARCRTSRATASPWPWCQPWAVPRRIASSHCARSRLEQAPQPVRRGAYRRPGAPGASACSSASCARGSARPDQQGLRGPSDAAPLVEQGGVGEAEPVHVGHQVEADPLAQPARAR